LSSKSAHYGQPVLIDSNDTTRQKRKGPTSELLYISVVIPTLNEAGNIGELLLRLDQTMAQAGVLYEAIIVDDRSTDGTREIATMIAVENFLPVRVLIKQGQIGKSFSLMEGFAVARYDLLAMIDGDLQYSPTELLKLVNKLTEADLIVGDRRAAHAASPLRRVMSGIFKGLVNKLLGLDTDVQCGLKLFRRRVYEGFEFHYGKWNLDMYLVMHALRYGYKIGNVPVVVEPRHAGESKVAPSSVALELLKSVVMIKVVAVVRVLKRFLEGVNRD